MKNSAINKKVLLLSLSGLGNFLMQSPVFSILKQTHPDWRLTVWVAPGRGTKSLADHNPNIDEVIEMPIKASPWRHLKQIKYLRAKIFDLGLVLSPGQLIKSAAYLFLSGIPQRLGHAYPLGKNPASSFLLTHTVPENSDLHDIEQNLSLLKALNITLPHHPAYQLTIPPINQTQANHLWLSLNIPQTKTIISFHPGSAPNFQWKRWPLENFITAGQNLIKNHNAHILIFGGPAEASLKQKLGSALTGNSSVISSDLLTTTALLRKCRLLLTNDSGLMHLASASGVPVLALFGPTNENQTGPRGQNAHVLRAPGTLSLYHTEKNFNFTQSPHSTLKQLSPDLVIQTLAQLL